jgi:hypothetical protein
MNRVSYFFFNTRTLLRTCLLRVFGRHAWVERKKFELGSLVNLYLGFNGTSDLQGRMAKLESLKCRTETVLKRYCRGAYGAFKALTFRVNNVKAFVEDLCSACGIVHRELIRAQNDLNRLETLGRVVRCVSGKNSF